MIQAEQKKETPLEKFIAMLKGQKTRSAAHQLILTLYEKKIQTDEEGRQLAVLLKAERAKASAKKATLAVSNLIGARGEAERKARNHRLIQQGLLIDLSGMQDWDKAELLGGLTMLANTRIEERAGWKQSGEVMLSKASTTEKTPQPIQASLSEQHSIQTLETAASSTKQQQTEKRVATVPTILTKAGYPEKETVKALGAAYDNDIKKWIVPAGYDLAPFQNWL